MTQPTRSRMTRAQRRLQLIEIARASFAKRGYDGTSIEEIAAAAEVSKPVIYEHFGGKEGLYQVVVDREISTLMEKVSATMPEDVPPRKALEHSVMALLDYMEAYPDGYKLLVHQSPTGVSSGVFSPVIGEVAEGLTLLLARHFERQGLEADTAPVYGQLLGGAMAQVGLWYLSERDSGGAFGWTKDELASHTVNFLWNGLHHLEASPALYLADSAPEAEK